MRVMTAAQLVRVHASFRGLKIGQRLEEFSHYKVVERSETRGECY